MKPYYERDGIVIYHGDARDVLAALELADVDVVLTDPPYGIDGGRGSLSRTRARGDYAAAFHDGGDYIRSVVVPLVRQLVEQVPCVVITPGNRHLTDYPRPDSFGVFYQPAAVGLQSFGNLDAQPILYYGKNPLGRIMGVPCSYVLTETPEPNGHPCPKPLRAWRRLLSNVSRPGQVILDPFLGSGTTLRAAKDIERKGIGIELEERFCEIAARRLSQEVLSLELAPAAAR